MKPYFEKPLVRTINASFFKEFSKKKPFGRVFSSYDLSAMLRFTVQTRYSIFAGLCGK